MDDATLIDLIRDCVISDQIEEAVVYRDRNPLKAGERVGAGLEAPVMPFDGILVFVDLAPQFNWAHPCLLVLVREDGLDSQVIQSSFPPRGRGFPVQYQLIMRCGQEVSDVGSSQPGAKSQRT